MVTEAIMTGGGVTHKEEFEAFVGGLDEQDGAYVELCPRCHDYPCCCNLLEYIDGLGDSDWATEMEEE